MLTRRYSWFQLIESPCVHCHRSELTATWNDGLFSGCLFQVFPPLCPLIRTTQLVKRGPYITETDAPSPPISMCQLLVNITAWPLADAIPTPADDFSDVPDVESTTARGNTRIRNMHHTRCTPSEDNRNGLEQRMSMSDAMMYHHVLSLPWRLVLMLDSSTFCGLITQSSTGDADSGIQVVALMLRTFATWYITQRRQFTDLTRTHTSRRYQLPSTS